MFGFLFKKRPAPEFPVQITLASDPDDGPDETPQEESAIIPEFLTGTSIAGLTLAIEYKRELRRVTLRRIDPQEGGYLHILAFCHEAMGIRTFRSDRITSLIDWKTGEVFTDVPAYMAYLIDLGKIGQDPEADQKRAAERVRLGLTVLMYLARVDGRVHAAESAVVRAYCQAACETLTPAIKFYNLDKIVSYAERLYPEPEVFRKAVNRIATKRWRKLVALTLNSAEQVIRADGIIDPREVEAFAAIRDAFGVD